MGTSVKAAILNDFAQEMARVADKIDPTTVTVSWSKHRHIATYYYEYPGTNNPHVSVDIIEITKPDEKTYRAEYRDSAFVFQSFPSYDQVAEAVEK